MGSYQWGKKYFSGYVQKMPKKAKFIAIRCFNFWVQQWQLPSLDTYGFVWPDWFLACVILWIRFFFLHIIFIDQRFLFFSFGKNDIIGHVIKRITLPSLSFSSNFKWIFIMHPSLFMVCEVFYLNQKSNWSVFCSPFCTWYLTGKKILNGFYKQKITR